MCNRLWTPKAVRRARSESINTATVKLLNDIWNNKNIEVIDSFFSNKIINHNPLISTVGLEDFKTKFLHPLFDAFPDLKWVSHEIVSHDLLTVVLRWTLTGSHQKDFFGHPPTNKIVSWEGCSFIHLDDEEIIYELRSFFDTRVLFNTLSQK